MGFKSTSSFALFLSLNLLFFVIASACGTCTTPANPTPYKPSPKPNPKPHPTVPTPSPAHKAKCPRDTLKLACCTNLLGPISAVIGNPPNYPCCALIEGLVDLEAALCLCTALKANIINVINLKIDIALSLLINTCGKKLPSGFQCA